jgi:hypothetical protein
MTVGDSPLPSPDGIGALPKDKRISSLKALALYNQDTPREKE